MNLSIKNLHKVYDGQCVLSIDNLSIERGSFLGIIGPNGAGKSTLIKIIAGLIKSSSGSVKYNNSMLSSKVQKNMTLVFQKPYLLRSTVFNNIAYPLKVRKIKSGEIEKRVKEVMKLLEIEDLKNQKALTLSGGEAQKVALARAMVIKPSILLLDEPTANIDPNSVLVMEEAVKRFHKENNATVIIITHNLQQARRLCHEVAFMNKGRVIEMDKIDKVLSNPESSVTRRFIEGELLI